jgi:acid phosphatase
MKPPSEKGNLFYVPLFPDCRGRKGKAMKRILFHPSFLVLVPALFLAGCLLRDPFNDSFPAPPDPAALPSLPSGPSLQVLAFGDWGTGGDGQRALAETMAATHADSPPDFVLTLGDNFYPDGVTGPDDPMWESHFESVYAGPFWEDMRFQAILGNHDHHGDPDAQVQYSSVSDRWDMPDSYYVVVREIPGGGSALFMALDTEPIAKRTSGSREQREWADSVLRRTSADWILMAGHHPVATNGWHKPEGTVRSALWPLMGARVDVYLSGHNHSTELIETEVGTLQGVCGGGGGLDNPYRVKPTPSTISHFTNGGWCFLRIWPDIMAVDLHDREGAIQARYLIEK